MNPPINIPCWITRKFISEHRELTFLYSSDYLGNSFQGQCAHACGEPNAYPIPVKRRGLCRREDAYFSDVDYDLHTFKLDEYFNRIPTDKPIIPFPNIGKGDSDILIRAPRIYKYIAKRIALIKYDNINWI